MAYLTKAQAYRQAERLAHHIRKYGVKVVIDLRTGAGGGHWGVDTFWGAMDHHIVSKPSQGLTPFYKLVRNGRDDVPGPLCNVYGGWDMVARIVTMGLANHSGRGGPWVISGHRIPRDNGRYYFLGTEFEGGQNEADWSPEYRHFMGAVSAGKLDYIRELRGPGVTIHDTALCEHSSWAQPKGRKIDRLGYDQARGIAEMQAARKLVVPATKPPVIVPEPKSSISSILEGTMPLWTFFFIDGGHHVVNNVTGQYAQVPSDQVDRFTRWLDSKDIQWNWHENQAKTSREVNPADLSFVAPNGKFEWGKGPVV